MKGTLSVQQADDSWQEVEGVRSGEPQSMYGRITSAVRALTSWLGRLAPERQLTLGAPYLPHNRARVRARKARRHTVQESRRANR